MRRRIFKLLAYILLLYIAIFSFLIFWPRTYPVPSFKKRAGTQYWQLSTGSTIGYTLVPAQGAPKPYPVIYLHGGPGGAISERNIKALSPLAGDGYDVYLYDQVGGGQSARLSNIEEYTVSRHIKDLEEIIQKTGAEKVILIGQSWGAILATLFTAANPNKVKKIIFTSPGPVFSINPPLANIPAPDSIHLRAPVFTNAQGNAKANNIRTTTMAFWATTFGKKLAGDEEADNFATYLNYEVNKSTVCDTSKILPPEAGAGYYASVMTFKSLLRAQDPRPAIRNSPIPILVLKGECDNQKWGFTNEYLQLFPNHKLVVIPGAGHFIEAEQPQAYINAIRVFINGTS